MKRVFQLIRSHEWWVLGLIVTCALILNSLSLSNNFLADDISLIVDWKALDTFPASIGQMLRGEAPMAELGTYRPATYIALGIVSSIFRTNPLGYKLVHAAVFGLILILFFYVARWILSNASWALGATGLYGLSWVFISSLGWISVGIELWSVCLFWGALAGVLKYIETKNIWLLGVGTVAGILFQLAYVHGMVLVLVLLGLVVAIRARDRWLWMAMGLQILGWFGINIYRGMQGIEIYQVWLFGSEWLSRWYGFSLVPRFILSWVLPVWLQADIPLPLGLSTANSSTITAVRLPISRILWQVDSIIGFMGITLFGLGWLWGMWKKKVSITVAAGILTWALIPLVVYLPHRIFSSEFGLIAYGGAVLLMLLSLDTISKKVPLMRYVMLVTGLLWLGMSVWSHLHYSPVFRDAQAYWSYQIRKTPTSAPMLLGYAGYLYEQQEIQLSEQLIQTALGNNPEFAPAYSLLGLYAYERGEVSQAIAYVRNGLAFNPYDDDLQRQLVLYLIETQQYPDALEAISALRQNRPDSLFGLLQLGIVLSAMGEYEDAAIALEELVTIHPLTREAYPLLEFAYEQAGQVEKATAIREFLNGQ